ncbi:delta-lactam-biosynthetic de-N-acetylase [Clostridium zeae]|uniref:Delta-lactam-biosynthetic de-N-acetylase n=1 Tax=Clostridium zeae TaxID=2759022 RepID=A0ABQ1E753_9CLOT|nr:delta-lactam-biosynthetic de-N-acetylase [Clostridium zeae]GFZ30509.1 delta-lactam-biosynthetic de-N-acetylase [Clostridium zeae]
MNFSFLKNTLINISLITSIATTNVSFDLSKFDFFKFNTHTEHSLSNKEYSWYYMWNKNSTPDAPKETKNFVFNYDSYYIGDTSKKVLYITFDEGYENGNTGKILDVLKENKVPAAFFVVKPYILQNPDLIKRMDSEGHLVCNHSSHHPSMASVTDPEKFKKEFTEVEEEYTKLTGKKMPPYFRPPMGRYSEASLAKTKDLGYKTIFWSFAYKDWLVDQQPDPVAAKKRILERTSDGCIVLLHAVSNTNTKILDELLKEWKSQGYEFKSLDDLK